MENKDLQNENGTIKNEENELKIKQIGFFKKVWYSITKIEKYPEMAAQGVGRALSYLTKLVVCIALVLCIGMIYQTHNLAKQGVEYLQNNFPEFSYKEGTLKVESEEPIEIPQAPIAGKIIVDTNTENEEQINQYINKIGDTESGIVILKDKVLIKNAAVAGTISYLYEDTLKSFQISEFNKQDVINYINSGKIITLYVSVFLTIFIYAFVIYFLTTISNAIFLSVFGFITTYLARIKMRYAAIFNMSVYALTLSVILNILYIAVNIFITFDMQYFQVMYVSVAAIYLVAAILILKTDFMKKQMELMKIVEAQDVIRKQLEEKAEKEEEERKRKTREGKEKEQKDKSKNKENNKEEKDNNVGEEPEGSNA